MKVIIPFVAMETGGQTHYCTSLMVFVLDENTGLQTSNTIKCCVTTRVRCAVSGNISDLHMNPHAHFVHCLCLLPTTKTNTTTLCQDHPKYVLYSMLNSLCRHLYRLCVACCSPCRSSTEGLFLCLKDIKTQAG